jgi:hypothetical protein
MPELALTQAKSTAKSNLDGIQSSGTAPHVIRAALCNTRAGFPKTGNVLSKSKALELLPSVQDDDPDEERRTIRSEDMSICRHEGFAVEAKRASKKGAGLT